MFLPYHETLFFLLSVAIFKSTASCNGAIIADESLIGMFFLAAVTFSSDVKVEISTYFSSPLILPLIFPSKATDTSAQCGAGNGLRQCYFPCGHTGAAIYRHRNKGNA